jgi:hypothetical protein
MSSMPDDLLGYRPEFPILERTNYMISNSLGAMPTGGPSYREAKGGVFDFFFITNVRPTCHIHPPRRARQS